MNDLRMYGRFAVGLRGFLRRRIDLETARETVRRRFDEREDRFLRIVERGIYAHPESPYLPLLREAGCEFGDLRAMVRQRGLEAALGELRVAGVRVTFDQFKGRAPIRSGGSIVSTGPGAFDNPFAARHYVTETGGSTGAGTRIPHDLDHLSATAPFYVLAYDAHGVLEAPIGLWRGVLPSGAGVNNVLRSSLLENPVRRWFAPVVSENLQPALRFRLATAWLVYAGRILGAPMPRPEAVPLDQAIVVARWSADTVRSEGACLIRTSVSMALRVALAAVEEGLSLEGVTLMGGGEPPTPAKVRGVERSGARFVPTYVFSEAGPVGMGCAAPVGENDHHLLDDGLAVIRHPQRVPGTDREVDAFCFTTLLPTAPRLLLNVESDDFGTIEQRSCGCPLEAAGFRTHVRGVRSYRKLTGEGVTLVGSDMERILEDVLPSRFGGTPHCYQIHEREDASGFTRLVLVVDPAIDLPDEEETIRVVLEELGGGGAMEDIARAFWEQARTLRVERRRPEWTKRGKFPSLVVHGR